jgi:hypothetical protein
MLNETNVNLSTKINLRNVELFLLRILAGIDPITATPLGSDSVWKHPEIVSALLKLVREGKEAMEEDAENGCLFPF